MVTKPHVIAGIAYLWLGTASGLAQTKIEAGILRELQSSDRVKVIIITRPDPALQGGGSPLAAPAAYLSSRLGDTAAHVKQIGAMPTTAAEIGADAIERLREDPNVVKVVRDVPTPVSLMDTVSMVGDPPFLCMSEAFENRR